MIVLVASATTVLVEDDHCLIPALVERWLLLVSVARCGAAWGQEWHEGLECIGVVLITSRLWGFEADICVDSEHIFLYRYLFMRS